jgi:hypothetical protein
MGGLIAGLKALGVVRLAAMGGVAVAVLGLLALVTHVHLFWVAGLLLAFILLQKLVARPSVS